MTNDEFIIKFKAKWGDKFDYSKTICNLSRDKVTIICREHGEFKQTANNHAYGNNGCPECNGKRVTTEKFITKAIEKWDDKFDYSKIIYINNRSKVTIICREHNSEFQQLAKTHLRGANGCPQCQERKRKEKIKNQTKTTEKFITEATAKWNGRFDYSKAICDGVKNKLTIICREHNCEFQQVAIRHLQTSCGCPKCKIDNKKL